MFGNKKIDMINGPILSNMIMFAIPIMISDLLHMFYVAADTIVVGKFAGEIPLAAVGATSSLVFLFVALFEGLSLGVNVVVAKGIGEKDPDKVFRTVHTSGVICLVGGVLITSMGVFLSKTFLHLMSTPDSIINYSAKYMRIYFAGIIFTLIFNFSAGVLRAHGETRKPMYYQILSGMLNILFNLFFVLVLKMTVEGVALATIIAQSIAAFLAVKTLINEDSIIRLDLRKIAYYKEETMEIIKVGVPAGLQGMAFSLTNLVVQSSLNSFDSSIIIAGNTAANNIENFVYIGVTGFEAAVLTFVSQCLGARKFDRMMKIFWTGMALVCVSMGVLSLLVNVFSSPLLTLYTDNPAVIEAGKIRLFYVAGFLFLNGILDVISNFMRAIGYSSIPAVLMLVGIIGVRVLWLLIVFPIYRTLSMVYICFPISWFVTCVIDGIAMAYFYKKVKE